MDEEELLADFDRRVEQFQNTEAVYSQIQNTFPQGVSLTQRVDMASKVLEVLDLMLNPAIQAKRDFKLTREQLQEVRLAIEGGFEAQQLLEKYLQNDTTKVQQQAAPRPPSGNNDNFSGNGEFPGPEKKGLPLPLYTHETQAGVSFSMFAETFRLHREFCYIPQDRACLLLKMAMKGKAQMLTTHINPRDYMKRPQGLENMIKALLAIFLPSTESGLMMARFASAAQGNDTLAGFHGKLRYLYSCAYPNMSSADMEKSTELISHFRDNLKHIDIQKHVARSNPQTYQEALVEAQREEATNLIVAVNTNPALKVALGTGATAEQLSVQAAGIGHGQVFQTQQAPVVIPPPAPPPPTAWTPQPAGQPTPMEIGAIEQGAPARAKCPYCPDKPANHPVERCWRIRTAIRNHFGPDSLPEALAKGGGPRHEGGRGRATRGDFHGSARGRGSWRGGQRPQWRDVRNKVAALTADLAALGFEDEPAEDTEYPNEVGSDLAGEPDEDFQ